MPKAIAKVKASAKQQANAKGKQAEKQAETVKVSQAVAASVKACFTQDAVVVAAQNAQAQKWLVCGQTLAKEFPDRDTAKPVLVKAFQDAGRDPQEKGADGKMTADALKWGQYVSKILTLGFPAAPENLAAAVKAGRSTGDLLLAANNSLRPDKKTGKWVKVERQGTGGQGGHNKKSPYQTLENGLRSLFTAAYTAKLKVQQVANAIKEVCGKDSYNAEALAEALKDAAEA